MKNFQLDFRLLRIFSKIFWNTKMAQIFSGGLVRPTLQSENKIFEGQKKSRIPYSQLPDY